jgi:hypothetical protein
MQAIGMLFSAERLVRASTVRMWFTSSKGLILKELIACEFFSQRSISVRIP